MTRVVFMGSPDFAVPILRALARAYEIAGVVTQPDKPAGRGRGFRPPAIKVEAQSLRIPVIQPDRVSQAESMERIAEWHPDLIVVAAFGQILKPELLGLPPHGCVNVHASLLPRWRGASPIQAAIAAGDAETGVTIMLMDAGMDTGPILAQEPTPIHMDDTGGSLTERLSIIGSKLLLATLPGFLSGTVRPKAQDPGLATKAPILKKEDGRLDPTLPAEMLERRVRAFNPWPGAYFEGPQGRLIVHRAHVAPNQVVPEKRSILDEAPALGTSRGTLVLDEVQPSGKNKMDGRAYLRGTRNWTSASSGE